MKKSHSWSIRAPSGRRQGTGGDLCGPARGADGNSTITCGGGSFLLLASTRYAGAPRSTAARAQRSSVSANSQTAAATPGSHAHPRSYAHEERINV
jgi:hypothetical protein